LEVEFFILKLSFITKKRILGKKGYNFSIERMVVKELLFSSFLERRFVCLVSTSAEEVLYLRVKELVF